MGCGHYCVRCCRAGGRVGRWRDRGDGWKGDRRGGKLCDRSEWIRLSKWSRQRWSSGRTNNLIGLFEKLIVDARAFSGRGTKASVLLSEEIIK